MKLSERVGPDKLAHFAYGAVGYIPAAFIFGPWSGALLVIILGGLKEAVDAFRPTRHAEWQDAVATAAGAVTCLVAATLAPLPLQ